jgi:hypothetical protein
MSKDSGEPAFPVSTVDGFTQHGMTLRDWFAGQALVGIVNRSIRTEQAAESAYRYADAMLAERQK